MSLADRLREQRKFTKTIDGITFSGRRATVEEYSKYGIDREMDAEVCRSHVTDWQGMKESDLIEDGSKDVVTFDRQLFDEIIGDKPEWSSVLIHEILDGAIAKLNKRAENEKK